MKQRKAQPTPLIRACPLLLGVRWGLTHQSRVLGARIEATLRTCGVTLSSTGRTVLVALTWAGVWLGLVAGSLVDPGRALPTAAPWLTPWWTSLLVLVGLLLTVGAGTRSRRLLTHHGQLLETGGARSVGLTLGLSALDYPALLVVLVQAARTPNPATTLLAAALVAVIVQPLLSAGTTGVPGRWATRITPVPLALALIAATAALSPHVAAATALDAHPRWFAESGLGAGVVLAAGLATGWVETWLGRARLAPRSRTAARRAGVIAAAGAGVAWVAPLLIRGSEWASLAPSAPLLATFATALVLRTGLARSLSPEARGYELLLLREVRGSGARLLCHYLINSILLLAPVMLAGGLTLVLIGAGPALLLLVALWGLEAVGDLVIVQRTTVVLPAGALPGLGLASRTGLAAAGCFAIVVTATGVVGFHTRFQFNDLAAVSWVAALLGAATALLAALAALDAPQWLPELRITRPEPTS